VVIEPPAPARPAPAHPGPASAVLDEKLRAKLIAHARVGYPNEACGVIIGDRFAADGGRALRFVATRNAAASPYRYSIDSKDLLRITLETDDADEVIWGIVHSHIGSPARPSPTDIGLAFYPDALYLVVSLADPGDPEVRAWRMVKEGIFEVALADRDG